MKTIFLLLLLCLPFNQDKGKGKKVQKADKAKIQLAILLDTSNSMDGLIDQTKSQIWKMVNELSLARDGDNAMPALEIALYEYGNDNLPASEGHIREVLPLSTDLDLLSKELFGLRTKGGNEYCGQVLQVALDRLKWSEHQNSLRIIFIAGNEGFTQGRVDYKKSCANAKEKEVLVNTIFCGDYEEGINIKWKDGAVLAAGKYLNIDQNASVVHIEAPQDAKLAALSDSLNQTYIGYGAAGAERMEMQAVQDANARSYGMANYAKRAVAKSSSNYKNSSWDLVDAVEEKRIDVAKMKEKDLPENMQSMSVKERQKYIEDMAAKRKAYREQMQAYSTERREYVAKERQKMSTGETMDEAILQVIREQVKAAGYCFAEE